MMVSKITISITIFIAVVFIRTSESIEVEDCNTDDEFLTAVKKYENENRFYIPIIVTKEDPTSFLDDTVENYLSSNGYKFYIRVHVDNDNCPVANRVLHVRHLSLLSKEKYPKLFMMLENQLHSEVWYRECSTDINSFLRSVIQTRPVNSPYMESVSNSMEAGIDSRNRMARIRKEIEIQKKGPSQNLPPAPGVLLNQQQTKKSGKHMSFQKKRQLLKIPDESLSNYPLNQAGGSTGFDPNYYSRPTPIIRTTQQVPTQQVPMQQTQNIGSNVFRTNSVPDFNRGVPVVNKGKSQLGTGTEPKRTGSGSGPGSGSGTGFY